MFVKCRACTKEISKVKQSPEDILSREIENNHALTNSHSSSQEYISLNIDLQLHKLFEKEF
jgi:hypothetical protein